MACPYFFPLARLDDRTWVVAPRLPLGDPYTGECRAQPVAITPDEPTLRQLCNRGYGRGPCERVPETAPSDAVRFHVASQDGSRLGIQYVFEKDCWPLRHGVLEYSEGSVGSGQDAILERQAMAFAESYLRRVCQT
jgi:hypothetical protein